MPEEISQLEKIRESLARANAFLQENYKRRLAQLEEKYKDCNQDNPLPQEAINEIGILKDKIKE